MQIYIQVRHQIGLNASFTWQPSLGSVWCHWAPPAVYICASRSQSEENWLKPVMETCKPTWFRQLRGFTEVTLIWTDYNYSQRDWWKFSYNFHLNDKCRKSKPIRLQLIIIMCPFAIRDLNQLVVFWLCFYTKAKLQCYFSACHNPAATIFICGGISVSNITGYGWIKAVLFNANLIASHMQTVPIQPKADSRLTYWQFPAVLMS